VSDISVSDALMELVFLGLDHGIDSVTEGGPLIPFALTETGDGRELMRFAPETLEAGQALAREHVHAAGVDRAAIAYDGYLTVKGDRYDAIFVEAQERGESGSVVFAQRYRPGGRFKKFTTIGNPAFVERGESLF
jgi:hypothetical protein